MPTFFVVAAVVGGLLVVVGQIAIVVAAYGEGLLWMWACLLVPGAAPLFVLTHWHEAKSGLALYAAGLVVLAAALASSDRGEALRLRARRPIAAAESCGGEQTLPSGYAKWCCTSDGWRFVNGTSCAADPSPPIGDCEHRGTPALIACKR